MGVVVIVVSTEEATTGEELDSATREEITVAEENEEVRVDMTLALEGGGEVPLWRRVLLETPLVVLITGPRVVVVTMLVVVVVEVPLFLLPSLGVSYSLSVLSLDDKGVEIESTVGNALPIPRDAIVGEDRATVVALDLPDVDVAGEEEESFIPETGGRDAALVLALAGAAAAVAAAAAFAFSFLDKCGVEVEAEEASGVAAESVGTGVELDPFLAFVASSPLDLEIGVAPLAPALSVGTTAVVVGRVAATGCAVVLNVASCSAPSCSAIAVIEPE